jgi:hypothetical protein
MGSIIPGKGDCMATRMINVDYGAGGREYFECEKCRHGVGTTGQQANKWNFCPFCGEGIVDHRWVCTYEPEDSETPVSEFPAWYVKKS